MPTEIVRRHIVERSPGFTREKRSPLSKHLQKIYPIGIQRSNSSLSISPLSLSQNSNDSSLSESFSSWDRKISLSLHGLLGSLGRRGVFCGDFGLQDGREDSADEYFSEEDDSEEMNAGCLEGGELRRCNWITNSSGEHFVSFHDECWGVPVYTDNELFELLSLSGMLIDHSWTEIIRKREQYREAFGKFEPDLVANMEEKDIMEISSDEELMLAESRVRCIVDNARCILKVVKEYGSFSEYVWGHVNHRPIINRHQHPRSVPLRTPKSEALSKDLVRRGFRLVGPVIVYSFMQAAGLAIDHLVGCFRFKECVKLARRAWSR